MTTNQTTKTVTKTIETVTTITTVEVITEIKTITVEDPLELVQEEPKVQDHVVSTSKKEVKAIKVEKLEPKMTDPKHIRFQEVNEVEDNQVSTAILYTLLYWDTQTKHRKVKDGFIGQQLKYMQVGNLTPSKLWIAKDKFESVLYTVKGNYQLKPEFKARLEQYIQDNSIESADSFNNPYLKLKPYTKVQDQDFEFFKSLGHARKVKK